MNIQIPSNVNRIEERQYFGRPTEVFFDGVKHPDPEHSEDWVWEPYSTTSGFFFNAPSGHFRRKTIEEKEMEESMREVEAIAPWWKDEVE